MANRIVNAAPMVIDRGTQDLSTRQVAREAEFIPQHLPKFYLFTQKGPSDEQLVVGSERDQIFGTESFNLRGDFANHSTVFANSVNAQGNACMIKRLIPVDAGPEANMTVYLDVLETTVDTYERNSDGSVKTDALGDPIKLGTTPGHKVKWVVERASTHVEANKFGEATQKVGDQIDGAKQSKRYPIFQLKASSIGAYGNSAGIRLWAPTTANGNTMPTKMMTKYNAYPYMFQVIRKPDELTSPTITETLFGENSLMITFKPGVVDPLTDKRLYAGDILLDSYQNLTDLNYPKLFGEFGELAIYQANIDELVAKFYAAEVPFIDGFSDITTDAATAGLFNFVTGVSSANVAYQSYVFADASNSTRFSQYTNVYAGGGSDGTLSNEVHAALAKVEMERYLDPNDQLQDLAVNVESIIYDTGFPLETKYAICSFIAQRKDTFVVLSTHDVEDRVLTASEEHSLAIALRTRLQMYPESDYFGTPVMRGMIVGRCGHLRNSQYTKYLPLSLEIAIKSAKYMGASNGAWKNGSHFDGAPGSVLDYMTDISITWVPASVRNRNWDVGLNWVQAYDRRSYFFPALKTVYDDDTSVLNSYFTALAIGQLNKVAHAAWREFSGVSHLTNAQLVERLNDFVIARTQNRFDERFVIVPDAFHTDMDLVRGFSFTLPIKIYAASMKTVMTSYVQAYRISDLDA